MKAFSTEDRAKQLKMCCETIIDNAEKIMEGYELRQNVEIIITFNCHEVPGITVKHDFVSKKMIESMT